MFADAHAHMSDYSEEELNKTLERAKANGIELVVALGADGETSRRTVALAKERPMVYAAVGIHPWFLKASFTDDDLREIRSLANEEKVAFIGEIGLDMNRNADRLEEQKKVFTSLLNLAKELDLPVQVHCRDADREILDILEREGMPSRGGIAHGYRGNPEFIPAYLDLGFYISIGRSGREINEESEAVIKAIPLERLLLETDSSASSYASEDGYEPASVTVIAGNIAGVKGVHVDEVGSTTTGNLKKLMRIS
ncbi:MAG: TatD family hydrolase [Chloroflexi bacterium]|nr:TatD family hydrolase [Chloroflexota bacterium]